MKPHTKRNSVIAAVAAALAGLGITGAAAAQNDKGPSEAPSSEQKQEEPAYTGSVPAPQEGQEGQDESKDDEAAEAQALEGLATVSPDEARDAALAAVPGTADKVELDNENGFVVYSVEVTGADGTVTDVKVDAGNGQVLAQDTGEDSESGEESESGESGEATEAPGAEQPEGSEPTPAG